MDENIKDFPGYHIARDGCIYTRYSGGHLTDTWKKLSKYTSANGYEQVLLKKRKEGIIKRYYIHRLVAMAYIPNPKNLPCVGHKDNIRNHNHSDNLYWCTHKENSEQMVKEGRGGKGKKLRAILISDLHIGLYNKYRTRLDTAFDILDKVSDIAQKEGVIVIHPGDLFHVPEHMENELFSRVIQKFKELEQKDWVMVCISGNHSCANRNIIGRPILSWENTLSNVISWLKPIDFKKYKFKNLVFYGIPYIDNNNGLGEYINSLKLKGRRSKHILLLHSDMPGARDTDGRRIDSVENINKRNINKFDLILCGHIHKPQKLGKNTYMIGAPYQQRRTDRNCKMGYWELYSDLSMKFIPFDCYPRFIDVISEDDVKDDGNYYKIISSKKKEKQEVKKNPIIKGMGKKKIASKYLKTKDVTPGKKKKTKLSISKSESDD